MTRRFALAMTLSPVIRAFDAPRLRWRNLPPLPTALGGQFAGLAGDRLVVAGGSYFDTPPWSGGVKQRVDTIYSLGPDSKSWQLAGRLPYAVTSGAAASTPRGLLCIGGQNEKGNTPDCHMIALRNGALVVEELPRLPHTVSMHSAACDGVNVYVAGGQLTPQSTKALRSFLYLSLNDVKTGWRTLPELPQTGRILPVLIASPAEIFLISGAALTGTPGPPPGRRFLKDAYRFSMRGGWRGIADVPRPVQGGSGIFWNGRALVFSGNDGAYADKEYQIRDRHPGFSKDVLSYSVASGKWTVAGEMPISLVTTGVALWRGEFVIPGGEARPAHRSAEVLAGRFENS